MKGFLGCRILSLLRKKLSVSVAPMLKYRKEMEIERCALSVYFVDRQKIEQTLSHLEDQVTFFQQQSIWEKNIEKLALERIVYIVIESILDVGNTMIDGFIMRDPGSYDDIIDILLDEKVIGADDELPLKAVIALRKPLVQNYLEIEHDKILKSMNEHISVIEKFPTKVRHYLNTELGPISAFKP